MAEALISAFKDIVKYKIIAGVNTGDKTYDNLINTLLLAGLAMIFTKSFWSRLYIKLISYKQKLKTNISHITESNVDYYRNILRTHRLLSYATWNIKNKIFTVAISKYLIKNFKWKFEAIDAIVYDMEKMVPQRSLQCDNLFELIQKKTELEPFPVFISKSGSVVGINNSCRLDATCIVYYDNKAFLEFREELRKYENITTEEKEKKYIPVIKTIIPLCTSIEHLMTSSPR